MGILWHNEIMYRKNFKEKQWICIYLYMYINTEPFSSKEDCRSAMIHRMQGQWLTLGRAHSSQREILPLTFVVWNFDGLSGFSFHIENWLEKIFSNKYVMNILNIDIICSYLLNYWLYYMKSIIIYKMI